MLSPIEETEVIKLILSGLPSKVQCSNEKSGKYKLNIPKALAVNKYKFIQISHPKKYQMFSIDIDSRAELPTVESILERCDEQGIPTPTMIVKTNKGWHIHWYLEECIWKDNKPLMIFRKKVITYFNKVFGGDPHSAGFIMRNPIKHDTLFLDNRYYLKDFDFIVKLEDIIEDIRLKEEKAKQVRFQSRKNVKKKYDFSSVKIGERNNTLFEYMRSFMFRNYKLGMDAFLVEAQRVNALFPDPLAYPEIRATVYSVWNFVEKHYDPDRHNPDQTKYNRELAKYKAQKTYLKILTNLISKIKEDAVSFFKLFNDYYSLRALGRFGDACHKTVKKYLQQLKEDLVKIIQKKAKLFSDYIDFSFSYYYVEFQKVKDAENIIGVLRC